ncbi:hypothetical protein ACFLX8_04000 [Chloroflexota bacterium]
MENKVQREIRGFVEGLTNTSDSEIQKYVAEIVSNCEFQSNMKEKGYKEKREEYDVSSEECFSLKVLAIDTAQGVSLYALCRQLRPDVVVETGIASGVSSSYILCALEENKDGQLYSIDIPWHTTLGQVMPFLTFTKT